jgi:murein DD-endopeptidase MepM/ murein hydrolase activator NlpD
MKIDRNIKILWAIIIIITSVLVIIIAFVQYSKTKMKTIMSNNSFTNPTAQKFRISSPFGYRIAPKAGASTFHNGIDIACPAGTPVLSVADGTVDKVWNDTSAGGGLSIRIKHAEGYQTGYAHLSRQDVTAGQTVQKGQQIALSGNTGNSTGAHLHFTLKYNGVAINPLDYFYK